MTAHLAYTESTKSLFWFFVDFVAGEMICHSEGGAARS